VSLFQNASAVEMTVGEYNAAPRLRRTAAWERYDEGPEVFEGKHVSHTIPQEETAAMRMGTWIHYSILEPQVWAELASPIAASSRRVKKWQEHDAQCALDGRIALLKSEHDQVARITDAFRACKRAQHWLDTADAVERTVTAEATVGGQTIGTKARLDILRGRLVADLKSTSDPTPRGFAKSVADYGYWYQAAWYLGHEAALRGCDIADLAFAAIAVEKTAPFRVAIYELGPDWWGPGVDAVRWTLEQLAHEQETNTWASEWNGRPTMLIPPNWLKASVQERIGGAGC